MVCSHLRHRQVQARGRKTNNYFTNQFKYSYRFCDGNHISRMISAPASSLFNYMHILILALMLCPLSRLVSLEDAPSRLDRQRYEHLRLVRDASGIRLPSRITIAASLIAIAATIFDSQIEHVQFQQTYLCCGVANAASLSLTSVFSLLSTQGECNPANYQLTGDLTAQHLSLIHI